MSTTTTPAPGRLKLVREIIVDASILGGSGLVAYGSWLIYRPAAFIVAGLVILAAGINGARR